MISSTPIRELVSRYVNGLIEIPEFQRDFVWKNDQVKELILSIYRDYPIGMLILWEKPQGLSDDGKKGSYWLIDGQQRLLSLVAVLRGEVELKGGKRKSFTLRFNPLTEEFQFDSPRIRSDPLWIDIKALLANPLSTTVDGLKKHTSLGAGEIYECEKRLDRLRDRLLNYNVPVCTLRPDLDVEDVMNIFIRLNATGTRVKSAELYLATFAIALPNKIAAEVRDFIDEMDQKGWGLDVSVVVRTILAFLTGKVKIAERALEQAEAIKKMYNGKQLERAWLKARESLEWVIEQFGKRWNIYGSELIPSQAALVTLAYYAGTKNLKLSDYELDKMLKWFLLASYWGRYSNAVDTRLNKDLDIIAKGVDNAWEELLMEIRRESGKLIPSGVDFRGDEKDKRFLLYVLLKERGAKSLLSEQQLRSDVVQLHHIFPRALLRGTGLEDLANDVANLTFVVGRENIRIGNKEPGDYLSKVRDEVLQKHFIPTQRDLLKLAKFKEFLEERRRLIIEGLNEFFKDIRNLEARSQM